MKFPTIEHKQSQFEKYFQSMEQSLSWIERYSRDHPDTSGPFWAWWPNEMFEAIQSVIDKDVGDRRSIAMSWATVDIVTGH